MLRRAFAESSILHGENLLLVQQNCKKVVRVAIKATIVGRARVMKYEDIVKEQQLREEKEVAQVDVKAEATRLVFGYARGESK